MDAPNPSTPYNSIYTYIQPKPSSRRQDVVCCIHGVPCEKGKQKKNDGDEDTAPYVNLVPTKKQGTKTGNSEFNAALGQKLKDLQKGKVTIVEKAEQEKSHTKELRRIRNGLKALDIGKKPKHKKKRSGKSSTATEDSDDGGLQKKKEKKIEDNRMEDFDVKSEKRETAVVREERQRKEKKSKRKDSSSRRRKRSDDGSSSRKTKKTQKNEKKVEPFESMANLARAVLKKRGGPAKKAYRGVCGYREAENSCTNHGDVILYHKLEKDTRMDFLEPELPLFIVFRSRKNIFKHFRVIRHVGDDSTLYMVETGDSQSTTYSSLDDLVRHHQNLGESPQ